MDYVITSYSIHYTKLYDSVNTLWETLRAAAQSHLEADYGPERVGDVKDSLADVAKAKRLLGYVPEVSVEEGLKKTWEYFNG